MEFINRETSWLEFNARVLHEARDERTPLLERVRFLSIFNANLDEFVMKRVGGLRRQLEAGVPVAGHEDPVSPSARLSQVRQAILPLLDSYADCVKNQILPALERQGVALLSWDQLRPEEREKALSFFYTNVFPILTPLAVDPGHPFPFLSNLSKSIGVLLRPPGMGHGGEEVCFARVKVPDILPAWVRVNEGTASWRFVSLEALLMETLPTLFQGMEILEAMPFRITRNADIERDEEDAEDLLEMITEELQERRFARVVRLDHGPAPSQKLLKLLREELELQDSDIYEHPLPLAFGVWSPIADLPIPELKFPPWVPVAPPRLAHAVSVFDVIRSSDLLVHHPYESFSASVERFLAEAVADPHVLAIKMTLYRTGTDSPFIPLLIRAAEEGKQVVCVVELKARFDEEKNIIVAQALEKAGVHVVYGLVGLKTHCKLALVVREEPGPGGPTVRSYVHIGTGNYHAKTASLYTDLGLFSSRPEISEDVIHLFHHLTGRSLFRPFKKLIVAPHGMKNAFLDLIGREAELARRGEPARIVAKMNSLEDREVCRALCDASRAGVRIDLVVRGICTLRPGVPGQSENIRVSSVIGRFLEHSRIFHFGAGAKTPAEGDFLIGSADWMQRNLVSRVEVVVPVEEPSLKRRCWEILSTLLEDERQAWDMRPDGSYAQRCPSHPEKETGTHQALMKRATIQ